MKPQPACEAPVQTLARWLEIAAKGLCCAARERIAGEITEHVLSATEENMQNGLPAERARLAALTQLGDPTEARATFVREHLTQREADFLARLTRLRLPTTGGGTVIRYLVFGLASWLFVLLILAEYITFRGLVGQLTPQEGILFVPWTLWLGVFIVAQLSRQEERAIVNVRSLQWDLLSFYWLMAASGLACLASPNVYARITGITWLLLVVALSFLRFPLLMKLGNTNPIEIESSQKPGYS